MAKTYRTAQGHQLNMDKLRLQNEFQQSVGNMNVNARGDEIDSHGNIIRTRNEIMREHYKQPIRKDEDQ